MSSTVGLSVIVPTVGRDTLERTLWSCWPLKPEDRVFVVGDSHQPGRVVGVRDRVVKFGPGFEYHELDGGFMHYGCPQRNYGIELAAEGSLLVFQDDTDVFAVGGLRAVHEARQEHGEVPFLFECDLRSSGDYLGCGRDIRCGEVDGHMLVVPKVAGRVAEWPYERYESDFDWIERTLGLWPSRGDKGELEAFVRVPRLLSICYEKPPL